MPDSSMKDSVLIHTPDGRLCCVTKEYYSDPNNEVTDEEMASAARLALSRGAVLAEIHSFGAGVGGFCTLVDLQALRPSQLEGGRKALDLKAYKQDLQRELDRIASKIDEEKVDL